MPLDWSKFRHLRPAWQLICTIVFSACAVRIGQTGVDDSEYMRNGDYFPTRLMAEIDAVSLVCSTKTRMHPENNVGLVTMSNGRVVVTLTQDLHKINGTLSKVQPTGNTNFETAIRVAHLALKHRQGRNHRMRIVVFVGSPVVEEEKELVKMAKRLKKEKVNVDVICFGQEGDNSAKLGQFIATLNGKEGAGSHLLTVPPGQGLAEALATSVLFHTEDGPPSFADGGSDAFGMDHHEDPELAMALRVSMEEQRARETAQMGGAESPAQGSAGTENGANGVFGSVLTEGAGGATTTGKPASGGANVEAMTEEQQLAHAMRLSLCEPSTNPKAKDDSMDVDEAPPK